MSIPSARLLSLLAASLACAEDAVLDPAKPLARIETTELDFGAVRELERVTRGVEVTNVGAAPLDVQAALAESSSGDFQVLTPSAKVDPSTTVVIEVRYEPRDKGVDSASLILSTDDARPETRVGLRGGPIQPSLAVTPELLDFGPAGNDPEVERRVILENRGLATARVAGVALDPDGNPDFSFPPVGAISIPPDHSESLVLTYRRSDRADSGRLRMSSDDPERPTIVVTLLPDPYSACQDAKDNDGDLRFDFPDDPGCESPEDSSELDPPECQPGETRACGLDRPPCHPGARSCLEGAFGPCEGSFDGSEEICNGVDDDCDGRTDESVTELCSIFGCPGARACVESSSVATGQFTPCLATSAAPETCDGTDEDCDGMADDDIVTACEVNGCAGAQVCVPGGSGEFTACAPVSASPEICNLRDDDCNGQSDDAIPDQLCGIGACARLVPGCLNGAIPTCVPGDPAPEICNGGDDDCNGQDDDQIPTQTCGTGICQRTAPGCADGSVPACTPGPPSVETCNGQDDDCDGRDDDDLPDQTCGVGACRVSVPGCSNGSVPPCVPIPPGIEACGNGVDEDCNGSDLPCTACGLGSAGPDPQEPNDSPALARPIIPYSGPGTFTYTYPLTFPSGDPSDWIELQFPAPNPAGGSAQLNAAITCAGWLGAGCGSAATVGLEAWYYDDCLPQQDDRDDGRSGLAFVTSSGPVSMFGFCGLQKFRIRAYPSVAVCAGEAVQAMLELTVVFLP